MISIIVPVYNAENYLHRCVDSILAQSYIDFELLLIDDGSLDNSGTICEDYALKDSRVRIFHKPNGGVSSARNLGLDNARGEWITFIDSDDWVEPDYLLHLKDDSTAFDDFIIGGYTNVTGSICKVKASEYTADKISDLIEHHRWGVLLCVWGKLYKRRIIKNENLKFDEAIRAGEDSVFVLQYIPFCNNARIINRCEYNYRDENGTNIFAKKYNMSLAEIDYALNKMIVAANNLNVKYDDKIDYIVSIWSYVGMFQLTNIRTEKDLHDYYLLCAKYIPSLNEKLFYEDERFSPIIRGIALLKRYYEEKNLGEIQYLRQTLSWIICKQTDYPSFKNKDFYVWFYLIKHKYFKFLDFMMCIYVFMKKNIRVSL